MSFFHMKKESSFTKTVIKKGLPNPWAQKPLFGFFKKSHKVFCKKKLLLQGHVFSTGPRIMLPSIHFLSNAEGMILVFTKFFRRFCLLIPQEADPYCPQF